MKPKPDEDDTALFREAIHGVKPLKRAVAVLQEAPRPRARARLARARRAQILEGTLPDTLHDAASEPELAAGDPSHFARAGVTAATLRKLRRGQYRVQAQLDLHGLTQAQATVQLHEFLRAALDRDARCVRIVHGKGLRSGPNGPVLRREVNSVLRRTRPVLAFTSARQVDGGTGALYVLLEARA